MPNDLFEPQAKPGRDAGGRFARGNRLGTGNPFARRVAALRSALLEEVDDARFRRMVHDLVQMALNKDLAAMKLVFLYVLGRPAPVVDPDDLDRLEFEQLGRDSVSPEEMHSRTRALPVGLANDFVKMMVPAHGKTIGEQAAQVLRTGVLPGQEPEGPADDASPEEPEQEAPEPGADQPPAPPPAEIYPFATVNKRRETGRSAANRGRSGPPKRRKKKGRGS
jgi:hypothetical protein